MICPVCRSQNLESAKFCGNCGSPFPRGSQPSSSLINCDQGHVYSAVYDRCPYCPQAGQTASPADFATRIETAIEPPEDTYSTNVAPPPPGSSPAESTVVVPDLGEPSNRGADQPAAAPSVPAPPPPPSGSQVFSPTPRPISDKAPRDRRTIVVPDADPSLASPAKERLIGWVVTFYRDPNGEDFRLQAGRNLIGASPNCDIVIDDETVSGLHASIVYRHGRCYIKDELSTNGTLVNGVEIVEPRPLQNYDEIRIGNVSLTFVALERTA